MKFIDRLCYKYCKKHNIYNYPTTAKFVEPKIIYNNYTVETLCEKTTVPNEIINDQPENVMYFIGRRLADRIMEYAETRVEESFENDAKDVTVIVKIVDLRK